MGRRLGNWIANRLMGGELSPDWTIGENDFSGWEEDSRQIREANSPFNDPRAGTRSNWNYTDNKRCDIPGCWCGQ